MGNCSSDKSTEVKDSSAPAAAPASDEHQHNAPVYVQESATVEVSNDNNAEQPGDSGDTTNAEPAVEDAPESSALVFTEEADQGADDSTEHQAQEGGEGENQ